MRRTSLILALLPCLLLADDHWVKFTSGPFEVFTDANPRVAREQMVRFLEFRQAVGQLVGENDLQTPEPVRVIVFKNAKGWTADAPITHGRDRYNIVLPEKSTPDLYRELTRLFLASNTAQMPPAFEHGLVEFLSTFQVEGIRITVGAPPPHPDLDWARIHLLVVDPEYFGKIRVLLYNLRKGVDEDPAFRNAFGKGKNEVEAQVKKHFEAGNFQTGTLSSRPLSEGDFPERTVSESDARLARADLLAGAQSRAEYEALVKANVKVAEANEGLGLLDLGENHKDDARRHFSAAMAAGSGSARCYIEYAKLEPDNDKATQALLRAAGINPKLEEPFVLMAQRDTDPRKRILHWKTATERNPRNIANWKALAQCYLEDHNYGEAAKAWRGAEQAAVNPAEREQMHQARMSIEQQRLDYEEAERRRAADEEAREIEKLKAQARAEVHAAEAKANGGVAKKDEEALPWWEGAKAPEKVRGELKQVDCVGKQARLVMETADHKTLKLLVADPEKIAINGSGQLTLGCGAQQPRRVSIGYTPNRNAKLGTAGDVINIEFQ
jgi:hypothetical protein